MLDQSFNFNISNIIIFIGIIQGVAFGLIVLFNRKYHNLANYYLVATALTLSFNNLQYWLLDTEILKELYFQIPFEFIIMPFFYLFVDRYLQIIISRKTIFLIYCPFIISLLIRLCITIKIFTISDSIIKTLLTVEEYASLLFSILMIIVIMSKIIIYERRSISYTVTEVKAKTKWLKQALFAGIIVCVSWIIVIQNSIARFEDDLTKFYPLWITISLLVYWIVYKGIVENQIYNERIILRNKINSDKAPLVAETINEKNQNLYFHIINDIKNQKLYLDPELSLDSVAEKHNISSGYLSKVINNNAEVSFTDFINHLRIEEAKKLLENTEYKNYTIEAIGYESGFNSKSNFYTVFKKETNTTPTAYRKSLK